VRVAYIDGQIVINPTTPQLEGSDLDLAHHEGHLQWQWSWWKQAKSK